MAPRDPLKIQLDFPELVADLIRQLNLRGQVGLLDFKDSVQPTMLIAIKDGVGLTLNTPSFQSSEVFSNTQTAPPNNAIHADTGPLQAGTYDIIAGFSTGAQTAAPNFELQLRDAANAVTLSGWPQAMQDATLTINASFPIVMAMELNLNERLRFQNFPVAGSGRWASWIMAAIRPIP